MIPQVFEQASEFTSSKRVQLLLLAVTVLIYSVLAMAVGNSLFISHVGAERLPLAFVALGLCSMPAYALFSQLADRYSRPKLFQSVLGLSIPLMIGLWFLLSREQAIVYYIALILIIFQWDFHNDVLYSSLLTDYFTTLEYKRTAPFVGIAQALGSLLGGVLTTGLSQIFGTRDLLLCLPFLFVIAILQLKWLERSQHRLERVASQKDSGMIASLQVFPELVKRHPLIFFLAASSFLLVIIYFTSEFLWLNIYGQNFSESELTEFLGIMRVVVSLVQVAFLYGLTRPLLQSLGVARLNPVYPLTTLASLAGLILNLKLPAAIVLHMNGDALYKAINLPIHQLNYNAIPGEFLGRVRTLSDGLMRAVGLTLAGIVLWLSQTYLSLGEIAGIAMGLGLLLLAIRIPMGRFYAQGLEDMIRSDAIDLDEFSYLPVPFPPQSAAVIREFLTDSDPYTQVKGLELALKVGQPSQLIPTVEKLLPTAPPEIREGVVKLFSVNTDVGALEHFEKQLHSEVMVFRATALEILINRQHPFRESQLEQLLNDPHPEIQALAALALNQSERAVQQWRQFPLEDSAVRAVARVAAQTRHPAHVELLRRLLPQSSAEAKQFGLKALASIARPGDQELAELAVQALNDRAPEVRAGALNLLGSARRQDHLPQVAGSLEDSNPQVREQAARTLAAYGKEGLALAADCLLSSNPDVVKTAIAAIGQVRTQKASEILYQYLVPEFEQLEKTRRWQRQIPAEDPGWQPLAIAIEDFHQRLLQKTLYILSCLGHAHTVNTARRILATSNQQEREKAIEVLLSLSHRQFVTPLLPLLEPSRSAAQAVRPTAQGLRTQGYKLLLEAIESQDRWIRAGVLIALARIPSSLIKDPDPLIQSLTKEIFPLLIEQALPIPNTMKRLLFLKKVALFKNLSLDELLLINQSLAQEKVLANQTIFQEGKWRHHLYIIWEGGVQIVKTIDGQPKKTRQLKSGQFFGEVALFNEEPSWEGAIAIEDCTLLKLEKNGIVNLIAHHPQIVLEFCRYLSQRLRETERYPFADNLL